MVTIAITGLKGGVGKTAAAVNLAALAFDAGHRVLVWDLDPQASATYCYDLRPKLPGGAERLFRGDRELRALVKGTSFPRLDVVPADVSLGEADVVLHGQRNPRRVLRRLLADAAKRYDVAILDLPPGIGPVTAAVIDVADLLLVPVEPAPLGIRAYDRFADFVAGRSRSEHLLAPFLSGIDRRRPLHRRIEREHAADGRFLRSTIPLSSAVERLADEQVATVHSAPRSLAAEGYRQLWLEVAERAGLDLHAR